MKGSRIAPINNPDVSAWVSTDAKDSLTENTMKALCQNDNFYKRNKFYLSALPLVIADIWRQ